MPKILINEVDNTSAGAPGSYGNYSVLITGYMGTPDATKGNTKTPDENGVYEFSSAGEFEATICAADKISTTKTDSQGQIIEYHYGSLMAYHLLQLGYPVIYKVIESVSQMNSETFWEIFKDKSSYDFRFVSHGLLETCYDASVHTAMYNRINQINADIAELERIKDAEAPDVELGSLSFNDVVKCDIPYQALRTANPDRFKDNEGLQYSTFALAVGYVVDENAKTCTFAKDSGLYGALVEQEAAFNDHNNKHVTITTFNNINGYIAKLATYRKDDPAIIPGRGDCTALIELDEDIYCEANPAKRPETLIIEGINSMETITSNEGKYCAMTVPSVFYKMGKTAVKFPGAFHYLACFRNSLNSGFAEWYAAAGYTRGVASYVVDHTSVKLGEIAINALEPRTIVDQSKQPKFACNVIAYFRGSYYLWGNRTAHQLDNTDLTAHHFLNIRQLCTTIKKQLYVACRRFTFDPNSDTLWFNFVNAITPTLDLMKADQGIRDYRVEKVVTDKKATLKAKIRIIPIEAVEDFDLEISLEDSFGETSAVVSE